MTIKFTIDAPILDESVIHAAHRRHRLLLFVYLALAFLVFKAGWSADVYMEAASKDGATIMFIISLILAAAALYKSASHAGRAARYVPLAVGWCESALALAHRHPELDAYRKAVVSSRPFMQGDFDAMAEFAKNKPGLAACEALHRLA